MLWSIIVARQKRWNENASHEAINFRQSESRHSTDARRPSSAIDLPLKILIREDAQGKVWLSYNTPQYPQVRHGLTQELLQHIAVAQTLAEKAAE